MDVVDMDLGKDVMQVFLGKGCERQLEWIEAAWQRIGRRMRAG